MARCLLLLEERPEVSRAVRCGQCNTDTHSEGRRMTNIQEPQTTDLPIRGAGAPRHEKATTLGTHLQDMGTQVKDTAQDIGTQVKDTAQEMGARVKDMAQDIGAQIKDTAQDMGVQVKDTMTEYYAQGRERLREVPPTLEAQIRERPLQALLVAGGIGILLGLLTRRR